MLAAFLVFGFSAPADGAASHRPHLPTMRNAAIMLGDPGIDMDEARDAGQVTLQPELGWPEDQSVVDSSQKQPQPGPNAVPESTAPESAAKQDAEKQDTPPKAEQAAQEPAKAQDADQGDGKSVGAAPDSRTSLDSGALSDAEPEKKAVAYGPPGAISKSAESAARVPQIGLEGPEADGCAAIGRVAGLGREGLEKLSVKRAPDEAASEADMLAAGDLVWLCEAAEKWQGIIYASGEFQELGDCQVSGPVASPQNYDGPCAHGWVEGRFITVVAG